jgi:RND family efflux transporter MFP subunit
MKRLELIIMVVLLVSACKDKVNPGKADVDRPVVEGVAVIEVLPSQVEEYYETSGTVKAKTISTVASRVMGTVTSTMVKEGDTVVEGQLLLTIDDRDITQRVRASEQGYKEALKALEAAKENKSLIDITYSRYKGLYDEMALSRQEMDEIETKRKIADIEYERAKAMVKRVGAALLEAQVNHEFTKIKAPISGIVTGKKIEVGSMALSGTPLLTVEDNSSFKLEVNVDESLLEKVKVGLSVNVNIDSIGKQLKGQIYEAVPAVDPVSRTFLVKIYIDSESLKTGVYGRVLIPKEQRKTILVPKVAIVEKGQLVGVYVVDNKGIITYRLIKTGKTYNDDIEVLSGLKDGVRIVVDGIDNVVDGGIVKM